MLRYRLVIYLLIPLLLGYFVIIAVRNRDMRFLLQRLGFYYPRFNASTIWVHCASVGEVITALPLLDELQRIYPQNKLVITTNTVTGADALLRHKQANWQHIYLPMDWTGAVSRFLSHIQPAVALILETELWPELFTACHKRDVPLAVINARLSNKTRHCRPWMKKIYRRILSFPRAVLCRSEADLKAFLEMGAARQQTIFVGNLKFSQRETISHKPLGFNRPFVLAASTHDNEEAQLVKMWMQLELQDYLLVIAPRHPERRAQILAAIKPWCNEVALRSRNDDCTDSTTVFLLDTVGELNRVMPSAELVFIGGSLIQHGGHNLLEAARHSRPILFGPSMDNFREESSLFLENGCAIQVNDIHQLGDAIRNLAGDESRKKELGEKARQLLAARAGVERSYVKKLQQFGVL